MTASRARRAVLARVAGRSLAIPVEHVVEAMRALPIIPLTAEDHSPDYILGISRIRGEPCRVIDAARLLARPGEDPTGRFLVVRAGGARIALQVDDVVGVGALGDGVPVGRGREATIAGLHDVLREARWIDEAAEAPA